MSSSNFPRFDRNLNTGGNNFDEAKGVVARNVVHHSKQYPSSVTITVVKPLPGNGEDAMTNDRRDFLAAGLTLLAATLSERLAAEGGEMRVEGQQPTANPSRVVATKDAPAVNLDGWQMTATEVTIPAGAPPGRKHRHPGFVIGYVLEGQYSFAVNDQAPKVFTAGQMFFESFDAPGRGAFGLRQRERDAARKISCNCVHEEGRSGYDPRLIRFSPPVKRRVSIARRRALCPPRSGGVGR